jgi:WD40 repeat protein
VSLAGVLGAAAVSGNTALAGIPGRLVDATAVAVAHLRVAASAMCPWRIKAATLVLLAAGLVAAGVGLAVAPKDAGAPAARSTQPPQPAGPRTDRHGDPLPRHARVRLGTLRLRHGGLHGGLVAFSPDGKTLISAHGDGVVHFWEAASGKELRVLRTGRACFGTGPAALSPGGRFLALPVGNGLSLWDLTTGKVLHRALGHGTAAAPCLAFSPDGKRAATGSSDGARLWEVKTGKELLFFKGHRAAVIALAFSPDGKSLASRGRDGKVLVWEGATGRELWQAQGNPDVRDDLAWSPDGKTLALAQGKAFLRDAATGRQLRRIERLLFPHSPAFSPDGETLAVAAWGGIHLFAVRTGKARRTIDLGDLGAGSLTFSPDGKTLAATGTGSVVRLWDIGTGKELHDREGHRGAIRSVCFSPDSQLLATASEDSTIGLWDTPRGQQVGVCRGQRSFFQRVLFSPDGKSLFASAPNSPVQVWDVRTQKQQRRLAIQPDGPRRLNQVQALAISPCGTRLAALSRSLAPQGEEQVLAAWDLQTGKQQVTPLPSPKAASWPPELAPDGTLLASLDGPSVQIRDVAGKELFTLRGPGEVAVNGAFAPDNRALAGVCRRLKGSQVRTLVVWELITGQQLHRFDLGNASATASYGCPIAFSPDGRFLACGGEEANPTRLWDLATGKELLRLPGGEQVVTSLAFSPDGAWLAGGLRNGTALVWGVPTAPQRRPAAALSARRLEQLWAELAADNPVKAHAAQWALAATPAQTVALLRKQLRPVVAVPPKELARLLADLDSERFAVREAAFGKLRTLGPQAEPALRRALEGQPTAELRRRVKALLAQPGLAHSAETALRLRAIGVLEAIGSREARRVLQTLTWGAPAAHEPQAAKAALGRLGARFPCRP